MNVVQTKFYDNTTTRLENIGYKTCKRCYLDFILLGVAWVGLK